MMSWDQIGPIITSINILGMGQELIWFGLSAVIALAFATSKREYLVAWSFVYTILFMVGAAHTIWLLIVLAIITAIYYTRTRDNN